MGQGSEYSRPRASADSLGDLAQDRHRFLDKQVLLTGGVETLKTTNGRECLLGSLLMLVRICPNVHVYLPPGVSELDEEARSVAARVAFGKPVEFMAEAPNYGAYDAVLSVGTAAEPRLPWTVINSNGWVARVSSKERGLPAECGRANPIGALGAACLGVAEVFKRLLNLKQSRGALLDGVSFSFYSYRESADDLGPSLPSELKIDLGLAGGGAIGNGIVYLLSRLPLTGRAWVVDRQDFGKENLGTCMLIGPADIGRPKAETVAEFLRPNGRVEVDAYKAELSDFKHRVGSDVHTPGVLLCGLDSIEARHEAQSIWPDLVIDGAISAFGCQVSRHPWEGDVACLLCSFRQIAGERAEARASRATGLSEERAQQPLSLITEDDVSAAPPEKQEWLRARVGRQVCSVVPEGIAQELSEDKQRSGFEPSVPFVACLSACMVVGELVKAVCGWPTPLEPRFQFDVLQGPSKGQEFSQGRRLDCMCSTRRRNIADFRRRRSGLPEAA